MKEEYGISTLCFLVKVGDRSSKRERAQRKKGQTLMPNPNGNEQQRNDKMSCSRHSHLEGRSEGFWPTAFLIPPSSSGACMGGVPPEPEIGLQDLALPMSRLLMAVGHDLCATCGPRYDAQLTP
ncbi:hypothetical protein TanjilG_27323 [Lupinus angustifolius]|uniref:Uncharacterized protein n=1 Tax=Lupinus angustifolius TaxID=3871 RepID=A0A1J7I075_LUPAN|nr:hypothetical protein TanjilG_27323 [Lupinus angustifolius]